MTDRELARKLHAAWAAENPYDWNAQWEAVVKTARTLVTAELAAKAVPGYATDNEIEALIEPILIAAGSSLKHYSLYKPREEMRQAMRAALAPLQAQIATARNDALRFVAYNPPKIVMEGNASNKEHFGWDAAIWAYQELLRSLITTHAPVKK